MTLAGSIIGGEGGRASDSKYNRRGLYFVDNYLDYSKSERWTVCRRTSVDDVTGVPGYYLSAAAAGDHRVELVGR